MLSLKIPAQVIHWGWKPVQLPTLPRNVIVCAAKGPRPRFPRVWKTNRRIGTISKSKKLVDCIRGLSNVKEEVYGALDSFVAWELEFPLITVKKALKTLEDDKEWKRVVQMTKWMLSKGQGRTMGSYYTLLNALAEDGRIDEAEEVWTTLFSEHLESMPRMFFDKMISIYYSQGKHDKMFEVFADMEELGIRPTHSIVLKIGDVFRKLGMFDKFERVNRKYPPPRWEYRYIKGKRIKVRAKHPNQHRAGNDIINGVYEKTEPDEANRFNQDSVEQSLEFPDSGGGSVELNQTGGEHDDEPNVTIEEVSE